MALSVTQIANILFKKLQGMGSTNDSRQFFEEPYLGRPIVHSSQIWNESDSIPATAPGGIDGQITGVVQRFIDKSLAAIAGTSNSFYHADLVDAIPFNFGDGTYNYDVKDSLGNSIPFGTGDWVVDPDAGVLTFYSTVPSNMPPTISFYKYVGNKGAGAAGGGDLTPNLFTGDGTTVDFTLSSDPGSENNCHVFISGVRQQTDTYSVAGTTLTFSEAPPAPAGGETYNIEVMVGTTLAVNTPALASVDLAEMADRTAQTLLGRYANTDGTPQEITIGEGLALNSTTGVLGLTSSTVDSIKLGERIIEDLTGLIVLGAYFVGGSKATFRSSNASSGYQVPGGSSFQVLGISISAAVAAACQIQLLYADNDLGFNSAGAFTNPVYLFGDLNMAIFRNPGAGAADLLPGRSLSFAVNFTIPTGKYIQMYQATGGANAAHVLLYGKLV